MYRAKKNV